MGNEKQDGVKIFDSTGKPIGFIGLPERCANVCLGGCSWGEPHAGARTCARPRGPVAIAAGKQASSGKNMDALGRNPSLSLEPAIVLPEMASYSSPDRFIIVGAVALPFNRLRAYCNCVSFSGSFGTYD